MSTLLAALTRYGGILVAPRATVRALGPDQGQRDGLWLGLLYLLGVGTLALLEAAVTLHTTANLGGLVMLLSALGRTLVAPIVVLVACETILGRARAYRRGLMLVPLVVAVTLAHELAVHDLHLPPFVPEIAGGLVALALAWWVRPEVTPEVIPREDRA